MGLLLILPRLTAAAGPFAMADVLRSEMTSLRINGKLVVCGETITPNRVLEAIYAQSHFRARWTDDSTVAQLTTEIRRSSGDGLTPEDFHLTALERTRLAPVEELSDTRAQVGDVYRKTPVFRSTIKYMEINPTWTVPPGILDYAILPKLRKDPTDPLLSDFDVFDRNGQRVDHPETIPWVKYTGANLPYRLVQPPGPSNPVGLIKFIFPNPDMVFMHDTPKKKFFDYEGRDLSAGCVRIERPFELAAHLLWLDGRQGDHRVEDLLASGKTGRIHFRWLVPIILFYGTVSVDQQGTVSFRNDIYDRDPVLLEALDAPAVLWES